MLEWNESIIPDTLLVEWEGSSGVAIWPVVVDSQVTLPPVEQLRDLPLEALLQILSSNQPLYRLLSLIEKLKGDGKSADRPEVVVDAHRLVDTSKFLLQRTRRVSYAMRALKSRLEKPVFTRESLEWRLFGPIGVQSLRDAISREARTEEEKHFLLAELALELSRVNPTQTDISLKKSEVKSALRTVLLEMEKELTSDKNAIPEAVADYSMKAIKRALYEF